MMTAYIRFASAQPLLVRAARPRRPSGVAPSSCSSRASNISTSSATRCCPTGRRDATIIDPKTIDWKGVADGKVEVMIRQKPGPHNSMGRMKFMFPNQFGVYLHDNPRARAVQAGGAPLQRRLRPARGCLAAEPLAVRPRADLGGRRDRGAGAAGPAGAGLHHLSDGDARAGQSIAYFDDVYGRDKAKLAVARGRGRRRSRARRARAATSSGKK